MQVPGIVKLHANSFWSSVNLLSERLFLHQTPKPFTDRTRFFLFNCEALKAWASLPLSRLKVLVNTTSENDVAAWLTHTAAYFTNLFAVTSGEFNRHIAEGRSTWNQRYVCASESTAAKTWDNLSPASLSANPLSAKGLSLRCQTYKTLLLNLICGLHNASTTTACKVSASKTICFIWCSPSTPVCSGFQDKEKRCHTPRFDMATPPIPHTHVPEHVSEAEADISRVSCGGPGLRNPQKRSRRRWSFSLSDLLRPAHFSQGPDTTFANSSTQSRLRKLHTAFCPSASFVLAIRAGIAATGTSSNQSACIRIRPSWNRHWCMGTDSRNVRWTPCDVEPKERAHVKTSRNWAGPQNQANIPFQCIRR